MRLDLGAIAKAGTSKANQTGSWRNYKPIFHQVKCIGCGLCKIYCPEGCVTMIEKRNTRSTIRTVKVVGFVPRNALQAILK